MRHLFIRDTMILFEENYHHHFEVNNYIHLFMYRLFLFLEYQFNKLAIN